MVPISIEDADTLVLKHQAVSIHKVISVYTSGVSMSNTFNSIKIQII